MGVAGEVAWHDLRRRVKFASVTGVFLSALLLALMLAPLHDLLDRDFLIILQYPGFVLAASIWGVHAGGNLFLVVVGAVNAIVYGLIAFGLFSLGGRPHSAY